MSLRTITEEQSHHIAVVSFICACLIVLLHCYYCPRFESLIWWVGLAVGNSGFCRIAVPWFFLVSGFFMVGRMGEHDWYVAAIKKRLRTIVVPFYAWLLLYFVFGFAIWAVISLSHHQCGVSSPIADKTNLQIFLHFTGLWPCANIGIVWYLRMLMFLVFLTPIIVSGIRKIGWSLIVLIFGFYLAYKIFQGRVDGAADGFFDYYFSLRGLAYFSAGVALRMGRIWIPSRILLCTAGGGLLIAKLVMIRYNLPVAGAILDVLMVPGLMCMVWCLTKRIRLPVALVQDSFALYLMHGIFLTISIVPVTLLGMRSVMFSSFAIVLARVAFGIIASLLCAELIKRRMPCIADVLFGGR